MAYSVSGQPLRVLGLPRGTRIMFTRWVSLGIILGVQGVGFLSKWLGV